ncbi:MAG: hypothetical protein ACI8PZ_000790 [Myxococcota bacterium]|jgi:hypothetical protein
MLEIFPPSSLNNSILTSVLVGLVVVWLFQETYGWNFSGLVVPGYLASVLVVQPLTGCVIVVEAVATWWLVYAISDGVPARWPWARFFGRDRFFALCLASVVVRLALEGGGLTWLQDQLGLTVSATFHSMGLLVVPLAANAMWRMGPTMGFTRLGLPVVFTWLLLQYVLLPYTNLSLASFELTYEDVALDFVSSPRAYMLLLLGAWLGSLANLRFGWDFGGLIIPGLLAVCWLEPIRLVGTLGEAVIIATLIAIARRLPFLRTANLGGGRLLVLGFVLAYLLRFSVAWLVPALVPGWQVHDLFGFGYLLSTLIALRIHLHGDLFQSTVPAVVTSFAAFTLATAYGAFAALVFPAAPGPSPAPVTPDGTRPPALVRAAYADGLVLTTTPDAWVAQGPGLRNAGEGMGLLWDRGSGRPLAVSAVVGAPALGGAARQVADALDARFFHLCPEAGEGCDAIREALGRSRPVLVLTTGDESVLRAGTLPQMIDLEVLTGVVGAMRLEPEPERLELQLDERARFRAAQVGSPLPLSPVIQTWAHPEADEEHLPRGRGELRWLRHELADALAVWLEDGPNADLALAWAATTAGYAGLDLARTDPVVEATGRDLWLRVDRRGRERVVWVPYGEDPDILPFAAAIARVDRAAWLLVDATPTLTHAVYPRERQALALLTGAVGSAGADVVALRGTRDVYDPGTEAVLAVARPLLAERPWVDAVTRMSDALAQAGHGATVYDGHAQRLSFLDPANPSRYMAEAAAGDEAQVTLWASTRLRRDLGEFGWRHPFEEPVYSAGLRERTFAIDDTSLELTDTPASWAESLVEHYESFRAERVPTSLRKVLTATRKAGATLELGCDPWVGCRWLVAERCEAGRCEGLTLPLRRSRPPLAEPSTDPVARWILDAGLLGFTREVDP